MRNAHFKEQWVGGQMRLCFIWSLFGDIEVCKCLRWKFNRLPHTHTHTTLLLKLLPTHTHTRTGRHRSASVRRLLRWRTLNSPQTNEHTSARQVLPVCVWHVHLVAQQIMQIAVVACMQITTNCKSIKPVTYFAATMYNIWKKHTEIPAQISEIPEISVNNPLNSWYVRLYVCVTTNLINIITNTHTRTHKRALNTTTLENISFPTYAHRRVRVCACVNECE